MPLRSNRFLDREFSWIEFNLRVLGEAENEKLPILERLKFLAITSTNLDEFLMVRVGGIRRISVLKQTETSSEEHLPESVRLRLNEGFSSGKLSTGQLEKIHKKCHEMVSRQYKCLLDIEKVLSEHEIRRVDVESLSQEQFNYIEKIFDTEIYPVITPMAVSSAEDFPLLPGLSLNIGVRLKSREKNDDSFRFAVIPLPKRIPRFVSIPCDKGDYFVLLEDVICTFIDRLFPGEPTIEQFPFRITRNADLSVSEDQISDFLEEMKEVLIARKISDCIRLEIDRGISETSLDFLIGVLKISEDEIYSVSGPINLGAYMVIASRQGAVNLKYEPWLPQIHPDTISDTPLVEIISQRDVIFFHPYQSFDPVVRLINEAADDPDVIAIKQTLYRTSEGSPIVEALARAAALEKHVTALVELKARFDEARNIEWAQSLERSGVQVIYGLRGLKVHAKICLIVRREANGIRRYVHFGTGNYNEKTAKMYCDISLMTSSEEFGVDASAFFNAICGYSQQVRYNRIEAAPTGMKKKLIDLIESEAERSKRGQSAKILAKINSLVDTDVIDALYKASSAGVKVFLNVRGICCLKPGIKGMSENIKVVSIVDRFLEHARIAYFKHGGEDLIYISSADWMPRNLDRRVELMIPVEQPHCRQRIMEILESAFRDNTQSHLLESDGSYCKIKSAHGKEFRSQEHLYKIACDMAKAAAKEQRRIFEPQLPNTRRK
ncbi:MAG: polyphosphate kinase 1 [Candidatus Riflebacteria bacterium]|nr:polyphosphate kinase 1 [Candidatus Riflebacteria bacterium]